MSQRSGRGVIPFLSQPKKKAKTGSVPNPATSAVPLVPQDPPAMEVDKTQLQGSPRPNLQQRRSDVPVDGSQLPPPSTQPSSQKVVTATSVQHLFGALGTKYSEGEEAMSWWKNDPDENSSAVAHCLAEAFVRQASHSRAFKHLSLSHAEQKKKIQRLEWQVVEDKKSLQETYKKDLRDATANLRTENKGLRSEKNALEAKLRTADEIAKKQEEEIAKLQSDLNAAKQEIKSAEETFLQQGQVSFMKGFIRTIPDFNWDLLGPGNSDYALLLKKEIEEEDAEEARVIAEEEAKQAEEVGIAAEAANANEDVPPS